MTPVSEKMGASTDENHVEIRSPDPSTTRTGHDRVMLVLGVFLTLFFIAAGYLALVHDARHAGSQQRGPVKDPRTMSQPQLPGGETSGPLTQ
jgi:hypothetical protein